MSRPSLLSRLYLLLGVLGVGFLLLAGYLYRTTESIFTRELSKELAGDLEWMADLAARDPGLLLFPRSDSLARAVSRYKGYRITIIDPDGRVIGESQVPRDSLKFIENHAQRPEVLQARRDTIIGIGIARRYSPTLNQSMFYVAKSLGPNATVLRISAGPATLDDFRAAAGRTALLALLLFVVAAAVIALWVSRRISRPLLRLRVEARDVSKPLHWEAPFREAEILNEAFTDYADAVQKLAAEVRQERDRLLALLDRLEEGVVLLDRWGSIRAANASALQLLPLREKAGALTGMFFRDAIRHEGLGRWATGSRPGALREGVYQVEKGDQPDDSPVDLLCHLRVLQFGADEEVLLTLVDVTNFRNLDRAKTDFVANASHELKTPLSSILGYAETLLDGAQDNPAARGPFLQKILANAKRLQVLVQDLLNLSQAESQIVPQHVEPLLVCDFVQAAWNQHRTAAENQGIRFENRVPPDLAWNMEPRDLDLVLGNLIGNAVKYNAPAGKVRVDWDGASRVLGVRDTGVGVSAEALPRIFERFYRGGAARASNEGTGLGLAIVKHAAQRYGISVSAESQVGVGSIFSLAVPEEILVGSR
jgi:two-component system phosphate regulon sensor histidine kinase PhoR